MTIQTFPASEVDLSEDEYEQAWAHGLRPVVVNDTYLSNFNRPERIQIWYGGSGGGKSDAKATELLLKCLFNPYCRVMFCRKTKESIRMSQFRLFKDVIKRYGLGELFKVNEQAMQVTCTQNGNLLFGSGLDDLGKITSIADVTDIWLEEPIDRRGTVSSSDFTELNRRLRSVKATNHIHLTFNPISKESWIHDYFFKSDLYKPFVLKTTYLDNHFTPESQRNEFEILKIKKPDEYAVYALGEWGSLKQGLVFPQYTIVQDFPNDCKKWGYGLDWGFYPDPTAVIRCGISGGKLYLDEVIYENNLTSATRAEMMKRRGVLPSVKIIADPNPEAIAEMKTKGFYNIEAAKKGPGSIKAGIAQMQSFDICITARSVNLKTEIDNYEWAKDRMSETPTGDPVDAYNHCFVAGTLVQTNLGEKPIELIEKGDVVMTEKGFRPVVSTHTNSPKFAIKTFYIKTNNGTLSVSCTINHKIKINGGWKEIQELKNGDKIFLLNHSTALSTAFIKVRDIIQGAAKGFIGLFGSFIMGQSSPAITSTTRTNAQKTMPLKTLRRLSPQSILATIQTNFGQTQSLGSAGLRTLEISGRLHLSGTKAGKVPSGTKPTQNGLVLVRNPTGSANAPFVIKVLRQKTQQACFVQTNASQKIAATKGLIMLADIAKYVVNYLLSISTKKTKLVECLVVEVSSDYEPNQPVYDISVYNCHSFIADGLLVHNCLDASRYWCMANATQQTVRVTSTAR